jgi:hypothetical protein
MGLRPTADLKMGRLKAHIRSHPGTPFQWKEESVHGHQGVEITRDQILVPRRKFSRERCIVTGAGTGIGRATAIAAAANNLMTVGLDINEKEGKKTQKIARDMGGQMIFIKTDPAKTRSRPGQCRCRCLDNASANITGLQHIDSIENFPMEKYSVRFTLRAPFLPPSHDPPCTSKDGVE